MRESLERELHDGIGNGHLRAGMGWYDVAHEHAMEIAEQAGVTVGAARPVGVGAAIIAVLSPQVGWLQNLDAAYQVASGWDGPVAGYSANWAKAQALRDTGDVDRWCRGPKVRAFQSCIAQPWDNRTVVVDSWMARAANVARIDLEHVGVAELLSDQVRDLADGVGVLPMQAQATMWLNVRERWGYGKDET